MNTSQSTDNQAQNQQSLSQQQAFTPQSQNDPTSFASTVQALNQLMSEVKPIESNTEEARLRETTIVDNEGGRIELNEELNKPSISNKNNK